MSGGSRSLPVRPSLRYLKLEAKRRLAAGEFAIGLRGFPLGDRITDPRLKETSPARTRGEPPGDIAGLAAGACAELGLPALVLAGGEPGRAPWVVASGHAGTPCSGS
jgi:hypothetical protein